MARAHYVDHLLDPKGNVLAGATVNLYQKGTTTPIPETIYASDTGATTLTPPLTADANGKIEFYLADSKRLDLYISSGGMTSVTRTVDVDKRTMNPKGAWVTATAYQEQDIVTRSGSSYVCISDHTSGASTEPGVGASWTTVWSTLASKGDTGATGPAGTNGAISQLQDEGTNLTVRPTINFVGTGVVATDDAANSRTNVTVSGAAFVGCRTFRTTAQSIGNASPAPIAFDNETYDSDNFHDNVTNNTRHTVPAGKGGKYSVSGGLAFAANSTGVRDIRILVNGLVVNIVRATIVAAQVAFMSTQVDLLLAAGDYVEMAAYQDSGAALNANPAPDSHSTWFAMHYLGA